MHSTGFVYIMTNVTRSILYIGVTSNLKRRITEHKEGHGSEFTIKYEVKDLMFYEGFRLITDAIAREKQLKKWHKQWKWNLITASNPNLLDLSEDVLIRY